MDIQITLGDIKDEVTKEELLEIIGLSLDSGVSIEEAIQEFIDINYNLKGGKTMTITITKETAEAILLIKDRYYFDLFKGIRTSEDEEYRMRDAIFEIAQEIILKGVKK